MDNKGLIAALVLVLAVVAYWLYSTQFKSAPEMMVPAALDSGVSSSEETQNETNNRLFELKNSIQGVIADSVQDDIQKAVEKEIQKSDEIQKLKK